MTTPEFLGPYRVGESLGKGGMGSVFEAAHEKSGDKVAVKLISPQVADEMRFRRRFDAEIETLKRLRHPGIVQLIGYGEEKGQLFYSMELVDGEPLQKKIRREKRLLWTETINYAIQICAALKYAHDIGVIHRDLKPANLIITNDGRVKLVDFGIAKLFGFGEQTAAGSILGTADYMAPEQASNDPITPRTDLYALGSVMYAMLAGRPPFKGKRITQVIEALKRDRPAPLDMIDPDLPESLVEIVHELLEKAPDDRPPTALATMNRLKAMQAGLLRDQTMDVKRDNTRPPDVITRGGAVVRGNQQTQSSRMDSVQAGEKTIASKDVQTALQQVDPSAGTVHAAGRGPRDATIQAESNATHDSSSLAKGEHAREQTTHFQTVDQELSGSRVFERAETEQESWLSKAISIGLLGGALLLAVAYAMFGFTKPTAEEYYDQIVAAIEADNVVEAQAAIDAILSLYPNDELIPEIKDLDYLLRTKAIKKRLEFRKDRLEAHEAAYLEGLEMMDGGQKEALKQFQDWLIAYGDPDSDPMVSMEPKERELADEMVAVARYQIQRLKTSRPVKTVPQKNRELLEMIQQTDSLAPDQKRIKLESIIDLHKNDAWATTEVKLARKKLSELETKASP